MTTRWLPLALLCLPLAARGSDEPVPPKAPAPPATEGVEGLCNALHPLVLKAVPSGPISIAVEAEGAAVDLAESVRSRCGAVLNPKGVTEGTTPVHLRLRV